LLPTILPADENLPVVETETGFYYTVQEGDTLWDLSQRFNDSPWQWPDIWSKNIDIANPHLIYPGQKIRLYRRTDFDKTDVYAGISESLEEPYFYYSPIEKTGFVRHDPIVPNGTIMKVDGKNEMIGFGDTVFIRYLEPFSFKVGEKYVSYKTTGSITDNDTGINLGTQYVLTGVVEITRVEPMFCVASVVQSYRTISIDEGLFPYVPRSPRIPLKECVNGLYGKIIASENLTRLFGSDSVVFINKGKQDGVMPGQIYPVFYQDTFETDPITKERAQLSPIQLGELLVLHTEPTTSTVIVFRSNREIPIWSQFGFPLL
jgi:hypothetical protein